MNKWEALVEIVKATPPKWRGPVAAMAVLISGGGSLVVVSAVQWLT